jgi:hypothetical protein
MSFEIDSFAALRAIGSNAALFDDVRKDLAKTVPTLIEKQLKAIGADIERLRCVHSALGDGAFFSIVQSLGAAKALGLLKKLDKHNPRLKDRSADWAVPHLVAIARGECTAAPAAVKPVKAKAPTKAKATTNADVVRNLDAKAMAAKRKET